MEHVRRVTEMPHWSRDKASPVSRSWSSRPAFSKHIQDIFFLCLMDSTECDFTHTSDVLQNIYYPGLFVKTTKQTKLFLRKETYLDRKLSPWLLVSDCQWFVVVSLTIVRCVRLFTLCFSVELWPWFFTEENEQMIERQVGQTNTGVVHLLYTLEVLSVVSGDMVIQVNEHILLEQIVAEAKRPTSKSYPDS